MSTKMSLYCHSILLKNEQKFAKIHKRPRAGKSEKGLKIKGFQGFRGNGEIITTMFPKPLRRVRLPYPAPKNKRRRRASLIFWNPWDIKMLGGSEFRLRKCFCAAKAFYGAKAPRGTEWVRVPASIGGAQRCCRGAAMRDGVLRRLRLRGALALSGNSRWGAVLMMMNAAPIDSAGQNTMIIFRQRYRLWATRVCLRRSGCR